MAENSKIEWCDHTASPWHGCAHKVLADGSDHPGCAHCYAEAMAKRNPTTLGVWGPGGTRVVSKSFAANCRRWNKEAAAAGVRQRVFPSICDPFEDWTGSLHFVEKDEDTAKPINTVAWWRSDIGVCRAGQTTIDHSRGERLATMADARADLFNVIEECPWLDFLLLTKRPENVHRMWQNPNCEYCAETSCGFHRGIMEPHRGYRPNVWLGTSVSDQATAIELLPELLTCRFLVPVLFLSIEPLLGPIDFAMRHKQPFYSALKQVDWVIVGGESGPGARPCQVEWIRSIRDQCKTAGVPCFVKQVGSNPWLPPGELEQLRAQPGYRPLREKKGGDPDEWPEDLRVREFPQVEAAT